MAVRPKQWIKNLLVAAAPLAAGKLISEKNSVLLGILGFTAASSFGYLINDWKDKEFDRIHPKKKFRPFASRELGKKSLFLLLITCAIISLGTCLLLPSKFAISLLAYLVVTITYTLAIKNQPVLEMLWLSLGFLIRALAGSVIIQESPTGWFIVSIAFGALFIVSSKRLAEFKNIHKGQTRKVITVYNQPYLNLIVTSSVTITLLTYCLWVFQVHPNSVLVQLTIFPLTLAFFLYAWQSEIGDAEAPELFIFTNKLIIYSLLAIVSLLFLVIYL